ncbi:MAG: COX15/CtaA family protein [Aquificaceae bacterium]|jgi:cytochrome c oxidase assembly protein subunit 15|uniref:COX15/CtaA family protein n=1 Tax=Hydrogenobacter sp. Uz 6-8 TaxID=3384828 RepID=UPI0030A9D902
MLRLSLGLAILFTYIVMIWGGAVRSTDSGLACPDWPLCYGNFQPPKDTAAKLEMGHRTVSGLAGIFVFTTFFLLWFRHRTAPRSAKIVSLVALIFTLSAALTGMKMIRSEAPNLKYVSHMLLESFHIYESMIILGALVLTYRFLQKEEVPGGVPWWAYAFALTTMITGVLVRYTGSGEACGHEWPTCAGKLIPDLTNWQVALQFAHRNISYVTWLAFLLAMVSGFNRTTLTAFLLINLQFLFAISMVVSGFFLPFVFLDTAMGFFLFAWLTYNLQLKKTPELKVKPAW